MSIVQATLRHSRLSEFDDVTKQALANEMLDRCISNTLAGRDRNGDPFAPYSPNYDKSGTPNLYVYGELHNSMEVIAINDDNIVIGYHTGTEQARIAQGHMEGRSRGDKRGYMPKRLFIGLPQSQVNEIVDSVDVVREQSVISESLLAELF